MNLIKDFEIFKKKFLFKRKSYLAGYRNESNPGDVIIKWMGNKSLFDFYCLWEELFNENFKLAESREFKNDSAIQSNECIKT